MRMGQGTPTTLGGFRTARSTFPVGPGKHPAQRAAMRTLPVAALLAATLLAGCAHHSKTATPSAADPSPLLAERLATTRLLHIYAGSANMPDRNASELATALALTLRDTLRSRGFDVRGAETSPPATEGSQGIGELARAAALGGPLPDSARSLSYRHPNAPRLLLCVHLEGEAAPGGAAPAARLTLGGFLADSRDGTILWSAHVARHGTAADNRLRELATQLLATLPAPEAKQPGLVRSAR